MIYRIVVVSKWKDLVRAALEKFFQHYIIYSIDEYKDNVKSVGFVIEVSGVDVELGKIEKASNAISEIVGGSVTLQKVVTQ